MCPLRLPQTQCLQLPGTLPGETKWPLAAATIGPSCGRCHTRRTSTQSALPLSPGLTERKGAGAQVTTEQSAAARELAGHSDSVRSPGRGSGALTCLAWACQREIRCTLAQVSSLAFNVAGTLLASGGLDGAWPAISQCADRVPAWDDHVWGPRTVQGASSCGTRRQAGASTAWRGPAMLWSGSPGTHAVTWCLPAVRTLPHGCGMRLPALACRRGLPATPHMHAPAWV